jgi:hypothetical protein
MPGRRVPVLSWGSELMADSATFKPVPENGAEVAVALRASEPSVSAWASGLGSASGLLRPSQVPVGGRTHHRRQRLRPSGAPLDAATVPVRPSAVPARSIPEVLCGSGEPLAAPLKTEMEARLGADFSDVRVHTGGAAGDSAAELGARAYTYGAHVVVGRGGADKHTLAHELAHVVQQRRGPVAGSDNGSWPRISGPFDQFERAAEANARRAMAQPVPADASSVPARNSSGPATRVATVPDTVQRFLDPTLVDRDRVAAEASLAADFRTRMKSYVQAVAGGHQIPPENRTKFLLELYRDSQFIQAAFQQQQDYLTAVAALEANKITQGLSTPQLKALVQLMNLVEQEALTEAATAGGYSIYEHIERVIVGTEFTFTHPSLRGLVLDPDKLPDKEKKEAHQKLSVASKMIAEWASKVKESPLRGLDVKVADSNGKSRRAKTFYYKSAADKEFAWNWTLDIDEGCLETQTQKTPKSDLATKNRAREIIEAHIFGIAQALGCTAETGVTGGGGHISVDARTAFGGSAELFVATVTELEQKYGEWLAYLASGDRGATDPINAPWTATLGPQALDDLRAALTAINDEALQGTVDLTAAADKLKKHIETLPLAPESKVLPDPRRGEMALPAQRPHYQAVNIEHMNDRDVERRRLELRDIPAQRDLRDLDADLNMILRLFVEVREVVRAAQSQRLSGRHPR